jgi:hypothetical protein
VPEASLHKHSDPLGREEAESHWDYKPPEPWNAKWQNVPASEGEEGIGVDGEGLPLDF